MTSDNTFKKARLLEIGEIYIPKDLDMPCFASRSTAGPDAGSSSHAFQFGEARVKLSVTKNSESRVRLARNNGWFTIYLDEEKLAENVRILPLPAHAPGQAFLNLSGECRMGCAFCAMPEPAQTTLEILSTERAMKLISINSKYPEFGAVAITSGIPDSVDETNGRMMELVKEVREEFPNIPIGIEAYFEDLADIGKFKAAGATEMKINIETWPGERFEKVCPHRDFTRTMEALEKAVEVFGRGKVTSNIIAGLGESDEDILAALKKLAGMGVVPNVRGIRIGSQNSEKLKKALGSAPEKVPAERLLKLGEKHRNILEMNSLTTGTFDTMCFSCRCCDIVPMVDL